MNTTIQILFWYEMFVLLFCSIQILEGCYSQILSGDYLATTHRILEKYTIYECYLAKSCVNLHGRCQMFPGGWVYTRRIATQILHLILDLIFDP